MEVEKEKLNMLDSMGTCARERWFLLNLKAKFAGKSFLVFPHKFNFQCCAHFRIIRWTVLGFSAVKKYKSRVFEAKTTHSTVQFFPWC